MDNYKPNSNRFKEEQKERERAQKVVTGKVITKKKSKFSQFKDEFISEDAQNTGSYLFRDVLIPAIKKAVFDIATDGISMIFYGEPSKGSKRSTADRVSYRSYYDDNRPVRNTTRAGLGSGYSYDDIILNTRGEAEHVLTSMDDIMETYGLVRVTDLYDLVGITGSYTDNKFGWTNITNARIERVREGYMIKMPRAVPID